MDTVKKLVHEYRNLKAENDFTAFDKKLDVMLAGMSGQERNDFQKEYEDELLNTLQQAREVINSVSAWVHVEQIARYVSISYIAKQYFGKSRSWLHHKLKGDYINGKPAELTPAEKKKLSLALEDISRQIHQTALSLV